MEIYLPTYSFLYIYVYVFSATYTDSPLCTPPHRRQMWFHWIWNLNTLMPAYATYPPHYRLLRSNMSINTLFLTDGKNSGRVIRYTCTTSAAAAPGSEPEPEAEAASKLRGRPAQPVSSADLNPRICVGTREQDKRHWEAGGGEVGGTNE